MNIKSKDEIRDIIAKDLLSIHNRSVELRKRLDENFEDNVAYLQALASQLLQPSSGPLVTKTPKILRKRAVQRIETIPEDEVLQQENISSVDSLRSINEQKQETSEEVAGGRLKRSASKRAADNIKKQSITLSEREPFDENEDENVSAKKVKRDNQTKRKKSVTSSSDEEDTKSGSKYSKVDENLTETKRSTRRITKKKPERVDQPIVVLKKIKLNNEKIEEKDVSESSPKSVRSTKSRSKKSQKEEVNKVDDVTSNIDDIEELSMYEDAIGKPAPIMNSTLKPSSFLSGKILNTTVVLERLSKQRKLNETVVIQKVSSEKNKQSKERTSVRTNLQPNGQTTQYNTTHYNELITDDESSPEVRKKKGSKDSKKEIRRPLSTSSEDEIPNTPLKTRFKEKIASTVAHETKITYKSNALFSPYAKESVKKRVEAFEQAVMYSPKSVDVDIVPRLTRTKTRAMAAAAETETETRNAEKNVAQILARKSLAKAKRISLAKQKKGNEEFKENKEQMPEQITKSLLNDKPNIKQTQLQKMTPLSKTKMIQPSISRIHTPSHAQNLLNYPKALTASRANIVTNVDSFIQPPKSISKTNSVEKLEDKRRHEEDARKKREEALRLQTEEKRRKRQEKELKNKLAREAKEKQELVKRQKVEREREEKARLALLMQEKQREELEKKRLAQLQRAQEKEERRKLEEQQRLQKLQEQEETERLLAEQKRREQETEKRKEAEARAQTAETLKQKNQMLTAQAKYKQQANNKNHGVINYVLDSDPDDDQSDDENRPKHEIPYWAQPHVRKAQLAMQRYIAPEIVYKFFDTRKCTPDLTELFHGIDRSRLKRTSSAIWKTPPRISMMETIE